MWFGDGVRIKNAGRDFCNHKIKSLVVNPFGVVLRKPTCDALSGEYIMLVKKVLSRIRQGRRQFGLPPALEVIQA